MLAAHHFGLSSLSLETTVGTCWNCKASGAEPIMQTPTLDAKGFNSAKRRRLVLSGREGLGINALHPRCLQVHA